MFKLNEIMLDLTSPFKDDFVNKNILNHGFFKLSSGLLSEYYLQCSRIFEDAEFSSQICEYLAHKIINNYGNNFFTKIVSPAMGGILFGYELSRHLKIQNVFVERKGENNTFVLARGFEISSSDNILICEDVVTTAKSSLEVVDVISRYKPKSIHEVCIFDRSSGEGGLALRGALGSDLISLEKVDIKTFDNNHIPNHLIGLTPIKPGSRKD
jgi:orotate phosphoribosyltransferase